MTRLLIAGFFLVLGGCGGGGGGNGNQPAPPGGPAPGGPPPLAADQAETAQGTIQGAIEGSLVVFRGVRYAAPPVGDLRFKAPAAPAAFAGIRDALDFGAKCIQAQGIATTGEEDCLFMNIWSHNDDVVRPVMVNLHPGSQNGVGGDISSIEPSEFAVAADVVVINMNRRLSVMGSLGVDELIQENPRLTAGNYGLLDIIAALEWVQENIAEFNGDPDRVMLFGTSAGGQATCLLLGSPDINGLIHAASIQSAPCGGSILQVLTATSPFDSRFPPAVDTHREILTATGCNLSADIPACLRNLPAEELVLAGAAQEAAANRRIYAYLVDGVVVQSAPWDAVENQIAGDIPLIVGMAENEVGTRFDGLSMPDDAAYRARIEAVFPDPYDDGLYALYPSASYPTPLDAWKMLFGDVIFSCRAELVALNAMSGAPSYLYEITRGFNPALGATHSIDSPYLFGTFDVFGYTPDPQALLISQSMRLAWSSLAHDPTMPPTLIEAAGITWPAYEPAQATYVDFGDPMFAGPGHRGGRCAAVRAVFN